MERPAQPEPTLSPLLPPSLSPPLLEGWAAAVCGLQQVAAAQQAQQAQQLGALAPQGGHQAGAFLAEQAAAAGGQGPWAQGQGHSLHLLEESLGAICRCRASMMSGGSTGPLCVLPLPCLRP